MSTAEEEIYGSVDPEIQEKQEYLEAAKGEAQKDVPEQESEEKSELAADEPKQEVHETAATEKYADVSDDDKTEPADVVPTGDDPATGEVAATSTEETFDPLHLTALGLSAEEAKEQFGTPTAVRNAVRLLDQKSVTVAQQLWNQEQAAMQQQFPSQPPAVQPPAQQQMQVPAVGEVPEFQMPETSDGEEWDEDVVNLVKGLHDQFNTRIQAQNQLIEQMRQHTESFERERMEEDRRRYVQDFDNIVNGLGDEWTPVLGKGDGFTMDPNSNEVKARVQLDQTMSQLAFGRQQQGLPNLPREELMHRALAISFPEIQKQQVRKQVEKDVGKRQNMMTNRPTGRRRKAGATGESAAVNHAEKWYADRGWGSLPADEFDYETI